MQKLILIFISVFIILVKGQQQCQGKPNNNGFSTDAPIFNSSSDHGKLYYQKAIEPAIRVLHVYGKPYDMGFAHGKLLKNDIQKVIPEFYKYFEQQVDKYLHLLPEFMRLLFVKFGAHAVLDATYVLTKKYTPQYFFDELRGIADGSGIPYQEMIRIHMFPELIKAQCSMFGAWGPATGGSTFNTSGSLIQLRSLDWATDGPFQQYPAVIVYHPDPGYGHEFTILTWSGFIGGLTGFSNAPMGLSQKVWASFNGTDSREGVPFHFLLRDILQFDSNIDDSLSRIASARRTCAIHIGLGDISGQFRAIDYSHEGVKIYDDYNFPLYSGHPKFKGLVYIDKHPQPSTNPCLGSLLQTYYGKITPENTIQYICALHQTGDMHIAIYDFAKKHMYVSNATPVQHLVNAYDRKFIRFDLDKLFNEKL